MVWQYRFVRLLEFHNNTDRDEQKKNYIAVLFTILPTWALHDLGKDWVSGEFVVQTGQDSVVVPVHNTCTCTHTHTQNKMASKQTRQCLRPERDADKKYMFLWHLAYKKDLCKRLVHNDG